MLNNIICLHKFLAVIAKEPQGILRKRYDRVHLAKKLERNLTKVSIDKKTKIYIILTPTLLKSLFLPRVFLSV